jgi:Peptidase family M49
VSLANILAAKAPNEEITFIHPEDLALYNKWFVRFASMMEIAKLNCAPGTVVLSNFKWPTMSFWVTVCAVFVGFDDYQPFQRIWQALL